MQALDVGFAKAAGPSSGSLITATLRNIVGSHPHKNFETHLSVGEGDKKGEHKMGKQSSRDKQPPGTKPEFLNLTQTGKRQGLFSNDSLDTKLPSVRLKIYSRL